MRLHAPQPRLLDRHLFAHQFDVAPSEPVIDTLRAYRNADVGCGNALERDKQWPDSQPVDAEAALKVLDLVDGFNDSTVGALCDWLDRIHSRDPIETRH